MSYTHNIYKAWEKVKSKSTMRIYSLRRHRLKHEWNQTVWSVNNLRCGTAALVAHRRRFLPGPNGAAYWGTSAVDALACSTWANRTVTKRWSRFRGHARYCGLAVSQPPAAATCAIEPNRLRAKS